MNKTLTIALLTFWGLVFVSCQTRSLEPQTENTAQSHKAGPSNLSNQVYDSLEWRDSVVLKSGASARVALACVFPKESKTALADSIRLWILEQYSDGAVCEPTQDFTETLKLIGQRNLKADAADIWELDKERDGVLPICYERDIKVAIEYDDEQYTTLAFTYYVYFAGAHGSTYVSYATFRKSDGHLMDWDLLEGMSREELTEAIKHGLCRYFDVVIDELPSCLLFNTIDEDESQRIFREEFPLPATPPYLTADGVSIIYQQYEIACYAAGMPTCIVKPNY